jgi:hypothetical protein
MNELILGNNGDSYVVAEGELLMNGSAKVCPIRRNVIAVACGVDCMHFNQHSDGANRFAYITCTGIVMKIRLTGGK